MNDVFIIADLHFGHENMALRRGFANSFEHDEFIISQWNKIVTKRDTVWILGDITMEKSAPYPMLNRLNGIKKVVLGNHDSPQHVPELLKYVNSVCGVVKHKGYILSHCPLHETEMKHFNVNIHGHVHDFTLPDDRYINVSCDVLNYTPMLFPAEIKKIRE